MQARAPDRPPDPTPEPLDARCATRDGAALFFHGSAVALDGRGVLVLGPSGSGKSALSLSLMAHGARLICDDGVWLEGDALRRPGAAPPLIEARGIGLLNAGPLCESAPLVLVVDLSRPEPARLPPRRFAAAPDVIAELIRGADRPNLAPTILQLVRHGRAVP